MKFLHDNEVELSRELLASLPEGVEVIAGGGGYPVSAYPSVVAQVPAYSADQPLYGPEGAFLGMGRVDVPAHEEVLRLPAGWAAVDSFLAFVQARAAANPPASLAGGLAGGTGA